MTAPYAAVYEQDDSTYANTEQTINIFLAGQAPCGPIDTTLCANRKNFYKSFSTTGGYRSGYSTAFLNAEAVFDVESPIYFKRVLPEDALYGGAVVTIGNTKQPYSLTNGLATPESFIFADVENNQTNEKISVLCKADLSGSLGGTYFVLPNQTEFVQLQHGARAEEATITCNADTAGSLGGTYLLLPGQDTYLWFNVDSSNTDPGTSALILSGKTSVEVAITANATADVVATAVSSKISGLIGKFTSTVDSATVTVSVVTAGEISHGNAGTTGFMYTTSILGLNASTEIEVSGMTSITATYTPDATADAIATAINSAMTSSKEFTSQIDESNQALVLISAKTSGYMSDFYDVNTGFVFNTVTQGSSQSGSEAMLFYTSDPNALDISFTLLSHQDHPDDAPMDGTFVVNVYKDNVLETSITCSRDQDAKDGNGQPLYVETAMLASSYLRCRNNVAVNSDELPVSITTPLKVGGGSAGTTVTTGDMINATREWANKEDFDVTLMLVGGWTDSAYVRHLDTMAKTRGDCAVINSIPYYVENVSDYLTNIINYRKNELNINSSYTATFTSSLQVYNSDLNKNMYIPSDGHIAGAIVNASRNYEIFFPILGFKRGVLNNVLDVKRRYTKEEMDQLYANQLNPIRFVPGRGIVIWGQKTMQTSNSSLDRLNARLLLCAMKPQIQQFLEDQIGELNSDPTRDGLYTLLYNLLENYQGRQGILDFEVSVDALDPNNPNRLSATIRMQITPSVEYVECTIVLTPAGVEFS